VRICRFLSDGRRQIDAFYGEGDVFGFDLANARSFSAEAVTDCTVRCYQQVKLAGDKEGAMAVPQQLFSYAMGRLAKAQEHAMVLSRRSALERVAAFLVEWAKNSTRKGIVSLAMSRTDIGDYLGLTIETVSRTLSHLEREGYIAVPTARQIEIKNTVALQNLYA
jgi:CRP/FNR family nitrogen fixation transcriptional regulator